MVYGIVVHDRYDEMTGSRDMRGRARHDRHMDGHG